MAGTCTLVLIKPDAFERNIENVVLDRFVIEFQSVPDQSKTYTANDPTLFALFSEHYAEHAAKPFYKGLVEAMSLGPISVHKFVGPDAVGRGRQLVTKIREEFGLSVQQNTVHGSDSDAAAQRETALWFESNPIVVRFVRMNKDAVIPQKSHWDDAGMDLVATSVTTEYAGGINNYVYHTGIAMEIPRGHMGLIFPRSSISKTSMLQRNSVGVVDAGYRGEILIKMSALDLTEENVYSVGDRVAQLVIVPIPRVVFVETSELDESVRGQGAFGSTGK